ncbi:MAG: hypothetical protein ABI647_25150 [Gemmatimonadota bacterium]
MLQVAFDCSFSTRFQESGAVHPLFKALIVAAVIAIAIVVFRSQSQADEQSGWAQYGAAEAQGLTVESLESARDQTRGTTAEPWIAYQLAVKLYESGGPGNFDRSKQVAQEALSAFPEHPIAERLRHLIAVVGSYAGMPDKA